MSGQIKFGKVNPDSEEYLSQIEALAKLCHKIKNNNITNSSSKNKGVKKESSRFIEEYINIKTKYKDDITNWLIRLINLGCLV